MQEFWGQTASVTRKNGQIDFHNEIFDSILENAS